MYRNKETNEFYYGGSITRRINDGDVFSGIPTEEQLKEWGFEEEEMPVVTDEQRRMEEIKLLLAQTDYIVIKKAEGEDISKYDNEELYPQYGGNFLEWRVSLRAEYNELENPTTEDELVEDESNEAAPEEVEEIPESESDKD